MKRLLVSLVFLVGITAYAGEIGLPVEHLALPPVEGGHLVCIWDETANTWYTDFITYDHSGALNFNLPSWNRWYWVGLWDEESGAYVFGKWIGHYVSQ